MACSQVMKLCVVGSGKLKVLLFFRPTEQALRLFWGTPYSEANSIL